jgi:7-cyano-7-deazaguanine synthase
MGMVEAKKCVAILSGGVDSFCYAVQWKSRGYDIYPIIFDYGQKGRKEIEVAKYLCDRVGFHEPAVIDTASLGMLWKGTQLTDNSVRVETGYTPSVVVPIRNVVFMSIASAYALTIGASVVIYGAHKNDIAPRTDTGEPLYPDCSPDTARAFEEVVKIAHFPVGKHKVEIWSPAREGLSKAENLKRGYQLVGSLVFDTWSCYLTGDTHCGQCESCMNRHKAFIEAGIPDGTTYRVHPVVSDKCTTGECRFHEVAYITARRFNYDICDRCYYRNYDPDSCPLEGVPDDEINDACSEFVECYEMR